MMKKKSNSDVFFTEKNKLCCSCIILAAGLSERMGQWKILLSTRKGRLFLDRAMENASICQKVILVGGYRFGELEAMVRLGNDVLLVNNTNYQDGMLGSIQAGLSLVEEDFFILPVDMPLITKGHLQKIYDKRMNGEIIRPVYDGIPGHPVFFPYLWKKRVLAMKGCKLFSHLEPGDQRMIPWQDDSVTFDIDDKEAYIRYQNLQI